MTILGVYFPTNLLIAFAITLTAVFLTHLTSCIAFGCFDMQKYWMKWLFPLSLTACILYIPCLFTDSPIIIFHFLLTVTYLVGYFNIKRIVKKDRENGTLKTFHIVPQEKLHYVHRAIGAEPITMQENYKYDLAGKLIIGKDMILFNIGFLYEPDAEYEVLCSLLSEEDGYCMYQARIVNVLHRQFSIKRVLKRILCLYANIAIIVSLSAMACITVKDAPIYFPIEWYAKCINTLTCIGSTALFYGASKMMGKEKILRIFTRALFYILLICTIMYTLGIVPIKVGMYPPYM